MINNLWAPLLITLISALAWLRLNDYLAHRGWVESHLSRKIIHIGTGPIFVLCWLLFPDHPAARYLAALVPLLITLQFLLVGLGLIKDASAVKAMSRSGDRKEILRGPLYYGIVFVMLTILYWKDSLIGIVGLMLMCGGDGLADVVGKKIGGRKIPWSSQKTWSGSLGMLLGGWFFALGVAAVYLLGTDFIREFNQLLIPVTVIAFVGTLVESLPYQDIDNITVASVAVLLGHIFKI